MATNLGELFYSLKIQDDTDSAIQAINRKLQNLGSNIQIDANSFKQALKTAANGNPIDLEVRSIRKMNDAINAAIQNATKLKLDIDPGKLQSSINSALDNIQIKGANLLAKDNVLRDSIKQALQGHDFYVNIKVMKNQAQMAVQNALNNVNQLSTSDWLKIQRATQAGYNKSRMDLTELKKAHLEARDAANSHARATFSLSDAFKGNLRIVGELGAAMASLYSIHAAKEFLAQVIEIGGELEHQKIALDTIYGDPGKTQTLFSQIKGLARQSPFGVMDLTKNIKQLSAYGVAYNEVYDTAKRLADISAATSVDINRLILAFGKTKNRTFLDGLEAKQFAYANIPIYDALSKKLTELEGKFVSVKDVMGRIKKREIGFDMVKEILWDMTDEGGKFYNMQEKLAGSVKTSWKLVRDNIELMFGEMAESGMGNMLKGVAESLQGLTRNWKLLAGIMTSGVAVFGVSRIAALSLSRAVDAQTNSLYNSMIAGKKKTADELQAASITRRLTDAEKALIASKGRLTAADLQLAMANGNLTQSQLKSLFVSGKVTNATLQQMVATGALTQAEYKAIVGTELFGLSLNKLKGGLAGFGQMMKGVGMSLLSFITNPMTLIMAAISGLVYLWQRNSQEMEKAEDVGKNLFTKATEGAKNLKQALEDIKPSEELSDLELTQSIEKLEEVLKDYSPSAVNDINEALVRQDGHVNSLTERYEALVEKVKELKNAFETIKNEKIDEWLVSSQKATDEGVFNDGLQTNAKDYTNALKRRSENITDFAKKSQKDMVGFVDMLEKQSEEFRNATKEMGSYEAKFAHLVENLSLYRKLLPSGDSTLSDLANTQQIENAYDEMLSDTDKFIEHLNAKMKQANFSLDDENNKKTLSIALNSMLEQWEDASEEAKMIIAQKFEEAFGIVLIEDKAGPMMREKFRKMGEESGDELVTALAEKYGQNGDKILKSGEDIGELTLKGLLDIINYRGIDALTDGGKKMFEKMMEECAKDTMDKLGMTVEQMQAYLLSHPGTWQINVAFNETGAPSELQKMLWNKNGNLLKPGETKIFNEWSKGADSVKDIQDNALKEGKETLAQINAAKKNANVTEAHLKELNDKWDELKATYKDAGFGDLESDLKSKSKGRSGGSRKSGSQKDTVAEQIKQEFKDLKDAWSEYQKWQKSVGDEAAAKEVADSKLFGNMKIEDIPRTAEEYQKAIDKVREKLEKAGIKGHTRESLLNEILKQLLEVKKSIVDEQIEKALETVDQEIEKKLEEYNLYEKVRKATGNSELAYAFTFGMEPNGQTDYKQLVKDNFNSQLDAIRDTMEGEAATLDFDSITLDNYKLLPDEMQKAWKEAVKSIRKYEAEQKQFVADLLGQYQNTQEKIAKIQSDADEKISKVNKDDKLTNGQKFVLNSKIQTEADYEKFTLSNDYLQFFDGVLALTSERAEEIGALIQKNLNEQLRAGTITAKEYYDEIHKVEEQLSKIRNRKSESWALATGGVSGLQDKRYEESEAQRLAIVKKIEELEEKREKALKEGDMSAYAESIKQLANAEDELRIQQEISDKIVKDREKWEEVADVISMVDNMVGGVVDTFGIIQDMAESLGFDTESSDWLNLSGVLDTFQSISNGVKQTIQSVMSGDFGGALSGVASVLLTPITIWSRLHDKKLEKDIEASRKIFDRYQELIDKIDSKLNYFLGNRRNLQIDLSAEYAGLDKYRKLMSEERKKGSGFSGKKYYEYQKEYAKYQKRIQAYEKGGALGYERQLMIDQLDELKRQRADFEDMKGNHKDDIAEITAQIEEQKQAIKDFAEEMANVTYGIDLSGWASQIGDALVDAFAKGENAAQAFKDTVADIMRNLVSNMITADIIAPAMQDLEKWLFGEDGQGGAYANDFLLDDAEAIELASLLGDLEDKIEAAKHLYDVVNDAMGGGLDNKDSSSNSSRAGIQSVTEDTADLLASYVNSIRAFVAQNSLKMDNLINEALPKLTIISEGQLQQLTIIAEYTRRNMEAAESMKESMAQVQAILYRVTTGTDKIYVR